MKKQILLLSNGWAYTPNVWQETAQAVLNLTKNVKIQFINHGYFSSTSDNKLLELGAAEATSELYAEPLKDVEIFLVGHSFGLTTGLKFLSTYGVEPKAIIAVQSFFSFCGTSKGTQNKRKKELNLTIARFNSHERETLEGFYRFGKAPESIIAEMLSLQANRLTLLEHLEMLAFSISSPNIHISAVASSLDPIVPIEVTRENFDGIQQCSTVVIDDTTHLLPITHPGVIAKTIVDCLS